jgi:hypothetical protein
MGKDSISIEKVLNSRCSSDFGPNRGHHGSFLDKKPAEETLAQILRCLEVPRFSSGKLLHWFKDGNILLGFENSEDAYTQRVLHVESGMQQEAVYLACAAEGVGTCIHNQGVDGTRNSDKTTTAMHLVMEMTDPYETGKFTTNAPGPQKPFVLGKNLTEPVRDGDVECLPEMPKLTTANKSGPYATEKDLSQLLWATRGRTPHCVNTNVWKLMWGMTVPTWGGVQGYTSVYLIKDGKLHLYVNWTKSFSLINRAFRQELGWTRGNPTHDIELVRNVNLGSKMNGHERAIVLCQNENTGRTLWEAGYMLENMLLEARGLGISYESKIFSAEETSELNKLGIANAVAAVLI